MKQARELLPHPINDVLRCVNRLLRRRQIDGSASFFVIFWHLTASDIHFSSQSYDDAISHIERLESEVGGWRTTAVSEQKAERARLKARGQVLKTERDKQKAFVSGPMRRRLRAESPRWFGKSEPMRPMRQAYDQALWSARSSGCSASNCINTASSLEQS